MGASEETGILEIKEKSEAGQMEAGIEERLYGAAQSLIEDQGLTYGNTLEYTFNEAGSHNFSIKRY